VDERRGQRLENKRRYSLKGHSFIGTARAKKAVGANRKPHEKYCQTSLWEEIKGKIAVP